MDWYALFVVTGKEEHVSEWLRIFIDKSNMTTLIPKRRLIERRQGKHYEVYRKLFPGYILINVTMNSEIYSQIKKAPNLIRIVNSGELYTKIPEEEITRIRQLLSEDEVLDYSKVFFVNSRAMVVSGPLAGNEGLIKSVDKRKQRAKIEFQFMGLPKEIDVGIEILNKKEY